MLEPQSGHGAARLFLRSGCALLLIAGFVAFVWFALMGRRAERQVTRQASDPAVQLARVQRLFGVARPPAHFEPRLFADVPLLGMVGVLEIPAADDEFLVERAREMLLALEASGGAPPAGKDRALERLLAVQGLSLEHERVIDSFHWVAGRVHFEQRALRATLRWRPEGGRAVLVSVAELTCRPSDERRRVMLWIVTDPAPGRELEQLDVQGTPADRAAVERLFGQFEVCR